MRKILIIEDEPLLLESMDGFLSGQGYRCEKISTYEEGEYRVVSNDYDTIILDVSLPDGNGLKLLELLKVHHKDAGVLIVSARDSLFDKLEGLNMGADDYITKPFHLEELAARINALNRRKSPGTKNKLVVDDLVADYSSQNVFYKERIVNLTNKEYELLLYFMINKDRVVSKQSIARYLWGVHYATTENYDTVYVHAMNLRRKLSVHTGKDYIKTVYGIGYKFNS